MEQQGETDVSCLHPPSTHLQGGAASKVGNLGIQRLREIVSGDPAAGIDPAERLIGKVPLPPREALGLSDGPVKREMLQVL
jgi:hypothetical protein